MVVTMKYLKIYDLTPQMSYTINTPFPAFNELYPPQEHPSSLDFALK